MQHWIDTNIHFQPSAFTQTQLQHGDLFLDIETTGLSRSRHRIYLIGLALYTGGSVFGLHQFFADHSDEEPELLRCFQTFLTQSPVRRIITFNGSSFDLPFLSERAGAYGLSLSFDAYEQFDIYKECRQGKNMLQLQSYRQKSLEQFLGIAREDLYTGGELINVYERYTRNPDPDAAQLLRLHNLEDVRNMYQLLDIFAYDCLFSEAASVEQFSVESYTQLDGSAAEELIVTLSVPYPLPGALSVRHPVSGVYLRTHTDHVSVRIPLYQHMARMYYSDYKNYFYLPAEDMAMHKSVAVCVDPAYRKKATPETCYTRVAVTDDFLNSKQLSEYMTHVLRSFLPACITPGQPRSKKKDLSRS